MIKKLTTILLLSLAPLSIEAQSVFSDTLVYVYKLHGQTRKYQTHFDTSRDTLIMHWGIERNTKWQSGFYKMAPTARQSATNLTYLQPVDGNRVILSDSETFGLISQAAFRQLKHDGRFMYNKVVYQKVENDWGDDHPTLIKVVDPNEGAEMWILDNLALPLIWKMKNNPLEINWEIEQMGDNPLTVQDELKQCREKSGSVYYAYPYSQMSNTPAPDGYTPFYISHYGRHGSRWIPSEERYTKVLDVFDQNELTPLGKEVCDRLQLVWENAQGNAGQLTPLGKQQHREIAHRMYQSYPTLFTDQKEISARSSVVPRCINSMFAFCQELDTLNPNLLITCNSDSAHMNYIAYETPEMKTFGSKSAAWYQGPFSQFEDDQIQPSRLLNTLFVNPDKIENPQELMMGLYWIASNMQDVDLDLCFYDLFLDEELFDIWKVINYRMYVSNGLAPINENIPAKSATSLLNNLIECADQVIANESATTIDLRFGHDTNLLRLMSLMQLKEFANKEQDPMLYYQSWQDYKGAPMGANLQLIFYKNKQGDVLVKLLHNEQEQLLVLDTETAPYYNWQRIKDFWRTSDK